MNSFDLVAGLILVVLTAALVAIFTIIQRKRVVRYLRPIPAFQNLRRAIGLAIEDGKRLHISIGKSSLLAPTNASALVGLNTLERVGQLSMISDRPVLATSGDGALSILTQDTLRSVYRSGNALEQYDPDRGLLSGATPFSYIAGALPVTRDEQVSAHILIGNFGPEAALLAEAIEQNNAYSLVASDSLPAQAVLFASSQDALVGEEAFAMPAYLQGGQAHLASIRVQDLLRWAIILLLIIGSGLKLIGL